MFTIHLFIITVLWFSTSSISLFAQETITLSNSYLSITLNKEKGTIISIRNEKTNMEYMNKKVGEFYPFIVDAYSANQSIYIRDYQETQEGGFSLAYPDSLKLKKGDLIHISDSYLTAPVIQFKKGLYGCQVSCSYHLADGIYLQYTITVREDSPLTEWKVRAENKPAENPEKDLRVYRVAFPVLDGLRIGNDPSDDYLARPFHQGELIPHPALHSFLAVYHNKTTPTNVLTYLGRASMPWMDLYDKSGGLYFASYDPGLQQVDLEAFPDKTNSTMTLDMRTYAFMEPEHHWESQKFMIGIHEGDWHWAADSYRSWAQSWMKPQQVPEWMNQEDGWFGTGGPNYRFREDLPRMLDDARWLGINYLQIWSQMLENVGKNRSRKGYYCFFLPDPERGGEEGLTEGVRRVRELGGHIGFYSNVWTFDAELPQPLLQWKEQIPPDILIPDWWKEFRSYASVFPDGSVRVGDYAKGDYSGMCPAAEGWQNYLKFWIIDKYIKEYGVDTWYLDSMPVGMLGAARFCFSREHGEQTPHGVARGLIEMVRKLKTGASAEGVTLALSSEAINDALMQYETHALGRELNKGLTPCPYPEIYTYTFPGHLIFSGTCNTWTGISHYYDDLPEPRHEDAMNRVFLMGYRFDVLGFPINRSDPYWLYLKKLIDLRKRIKVYLYQSSFKDDIGLGSLPQNVEIKVFKHNKSTSLTLTIVDRRKQKDSFEFALDFSRLQMNPLKSATFYDFQGEKSVPPVTADGKIVKIIIPARTTPEEPAAVILK